MTAIINGKSKIALMLICHEKIDLDLEDTDCATALILAQDRNMRVVEKTLLRALMLKINTC